MKIKNIINKLSIALVFIIVHCGKTPIHNQTIYGLVIHGGAGTITREKMSPEKEAEYWKILHCLTRGKVQYLQVQVQMNWMHLSWMVAPFRLVQWLV